MFLNCNRKGLYSLLYLKSDRDLTIKGKVSPCVIVRILNCKQQNLVLADLKQARNLLESTHQAAHRIIGRAREPDLQVKQPGTMPKTMLWKLETSMAKLSTRDSDVLDAMFCASSTDWRKWPPLPATPPPLCQEEGLAAPAMLPPCRVPASHAPDPMFRARASMAEWESHTPPRSKEAGPGGSRASSASIVEICLLFRLP